MKTRLLQRPTALAVLTIIGIGYSIGVKLAAPKRFGYFAEQTQHEEDVEQAKAEIDIIAANMDKVWENISASCPTADGKLNAMRIMARAGETFKSDPWEANAMMRKELNDLRCGRTILSKAIERR